ncbi:MAG: hypothetical protein ACTSRG_13935 [Candidatus Helarchaeota archaeon]
MSLIDLICKSLDDLVDKFRLTMKYGYQFKLINACINCSHIDNKQEIYDCCWSATLLNTLKFYLLDILDYQEKHAEKNIQEGGYAPEVIPEVRNLLKSFCDQIDEFIKKREINE